MTHMICSLAAFSILKKLCVIIKLITMTCVVNGLQVSSLILWILFFVSPPPQYLLQSQPLYWAWFMNKDFYILEKYTLFFLLLNELRITQIVLYHKTCLVSYLWHFQHCVFEIHPCCLMDL